MTKLCPKCAEHIPLAQFFRNVSKPDGLQSYCKSCMAVATKLYKDGLPAAERKLRATRSNLRHSYGVTVEQRDQMVASQNGLCAICSIVLQTTTKGPCVDHNHATKEVRGILCSKCNSALGLLGDDPSILQAAIGYLNDNGAYYRREAPRHAQATA